MDTNLFCEKCKNKVKYGKYCGVHKKYFEINEIKKIKYNNINGIDILSKKFKCFQNDLNLGLLNIEKMDIKDGDLIFWKLDCKNRTRIAYTNKNFEDYITKNESKIIRKCTDKNCDFVCFSSNKNKLMTKLLKSKGYFYYQNRFKEYELNNCKSIDPRIEYITIFSKNIDNIIYLKELYQNSVCKKRNFSDFFNNYKFNGDNNFTDTQKFVQKCYLERNKNQKTFYICGTNSRKFAQENRKINCQMKYHLLIIYNNNKWHKVTNIDFSKMRDLPKEYEKFNLKILKSLVHSNFCLF